MGAHSSSHQMVPKQPQSEEPDAPDSLIPPSRLRAQTAARHKYLLSLDRSMKVFLRASNLPGLEYRLRLAGYHTFHDLLSTDRETLESKGFTGIMATRLLRAIADYLRRQLSRSEEDRLPFRLVRRGQRIQTEPSESMRENPNFKKRNVKRQKSSGEDSTRKGAGGGVLQSSQMLSRVRLMTESDLELQHLISPQPPAEVATAGESTGHPTEESACTTAEGNEHTTQVEPGSAARTSEATTTTGSGRNDGLLAPEDDRGQKILGVIVKDDDALLVVEEDSSPSRDGEDPPICELDDALLQEEALLSLKQLRRPPTSTTDRDLDDGADSTHTPPLPRSFSIPADLKLTPQTLVDEFVSNPIRTFSCSTVSPLCKQPHLY